eukprot:m51a1_g1969 hypothetical protein (251) ;mRNA; r:1086634-1087386
MDRGRCCRPREAPPHWHDRGDSERSRKRSRTEPERRPVKKEPGPDGDGGLQGFEVRGCTVTIPAAALSPLNLRASPALLGRVAFALSAEGDADSPLGTLVASDGVELPAGAPAVAPRPASRDLGSDAEGADAVVLGVPWAFRYRLGPRVPPPRVQLSWRWHPHEGELALARGLPSLAETRAAVQGARVEGVSVLAGAYPASAAYVGDARVTMVLSTHEGARMEVWGRPVASWDALSSEQDPVPVFPDTTQ